MGVSNKQDSWLSSPTTHVEEHKLAAAYDGEDRSGHEEECEAVEKDMSNILM